MRTKPPIRVWPFGDAPEEYQALSTHGGDEDWVVVIPREYEDRGDWWVPWLDHIDTMRDPKRYEHGDEVVYIGAHA